jgi:hypothetical protein
MSERSLTVVALVMSAVALGAVAVVVVDGRREASPPPSPAPAAVDQAHGPVQQTQQASPPAHDAPAPPIRHVHPQSTTSAAVPDAAFWSLVEETRAAAGDDTAEQSHLLQERLTGQSPQAIIAFERTRQRLDRRAYTWRLWGAANVIEDGCSDDCFRDFRAYLISLGRGPYERALHDPDSLASVARDAESGDWQNADDVAPDAYSSVTGNDFPFEDSDLSGTPTGMPLDLDDPALMRRYPRLAARFRGR